MEKYEGLTQALIENVIFDYFRTKKGEIVDLIKYSFELQEIMDDIFKIKIDITVSDNEEVLRVSSKDVPFEELIINFNVE